MTKSLIVYGTRYGATASSSQEIANILRQKGMDVDVKNAKEEKARDIAEYDLVIVGSGIQIHRWTGESEKFLKKFQKELATKKLAPFVCCGSASQELNEDKPDATEKARKKYLEEKAVKYNLHPVALGFFGGVYNYNKMPWFAKKGMNAYRPRIEAIFKESEPGVYDMRDLNSIRAWAEELTKLETLKNQPLPKVITNGNSGLFILLLSEPAHLLHFSVLH